MSSEFEDAPAGGDGSEGSQSVEERVAELESRFAAMQDELEFWKQSYFELESFVTGEYDLAIAENELPEGLAPTLMALQNGGADAPAVTVKDDALPIEQSVAARQQDGRDAFGQNETNLYRATYIWPEFDKRATPSRNKYVLKSSQVRQILEDSDGLGMQSPNPNTVKRAMKEVARYSTRPSDLDADLSVDDSQYPYNPDLLVTFRDDSSQNQLWASKDDWNAFVKGTTQQQTSSEKESRSGPAGDAKESDVDDVFDEIVDATPVTSPEEDTVRSEVNTE